MVSKKRKEFYMALKLLILGLPGSGKSSMARYIATYLENKNWESTRFSDHKILQKMFHTDSEGKQFKAADHDGFDILDLNVFDIALQRLEHAVNQHLLSAKQGEIVLIEFSRNDYLRAFQQFSDTFPQDAYFLYLDVDIETCKRRILERTANPSSEDDFFVSEYIFNAYYNEDDGRSIPQILARDYGIGKLRVEVIDNNGLLSDSIARINKFVDTMCGLEPLRDS
jgi:adenylate kinase family enzyme